MFPDQEPCVRDFTTRYDGWPPPGGGGFLSISLRARICMVGIFVFDMYHTGTIRNTHKKNPYQKSFDGSCILFFAVYENACGLATAQIAPNKSMACPSNTILSTKVDCCALCPRIFLSRT